MGSIAEEQEYEKRIKFYAERLQTCGYRFYDMLQIRRKEIPRLSVNYQDETTQQDVQQKVLRSADVYINCLTGQHHATQIPEYLQPEADAFKTYVYTKLSPKFILEEERSKLLAKIFDTVRK